MKYLSNRALLRLRLDNRSFGGHSGGVTPVPIPNTEVKPSSADGTWDERPWESRTPPDFFRQREEHLRVLLPCRFSALWFSALWGFTPEGPIPGHPTQPARPEPGRPVAWSDCREGPDAE